MYKNYETRVKEFITDMTNPHNQVVITDSTEKIENCRLELMNESKLQKPFIFKGYLTEQDRINDTVKKNRLLFNLPDYPEEKKDKKQSPIRELSPKLNSNIKENNKTFDNNLGKEYNNIKYYSIDASQKRDKVSPDNFKKSFKKRMSVTEKNQIKDLIKKDSILQPKMRFTARTDLERVYDALNGNYMRKGDREVIERQLKYINLFNYKNPKDLLKEDRDFHSLDNDNFIQKEDNNSLVNLASIQKDKKGIKDIYLPARIYYEPRNNNKKSWARKENLNTEAKELLYSYHIKTHFKATEEIAEYMSNDKKKLNESNFLLPHLYENNRYKNNKKNSPRYKSVNNRRQIDYSKMEDTSKLFNFEKEHEKDEINESLEINKNNDHITINNPIFKNNETRFDPHSMEVLSNLAFRKNFGLKEEENNISDKNKDFDKNDDNGENKPPKFNVIAKKILEECNVYNNKSKFNNTSLKAKEGKTMITKGLTIKEFGDKYHLKI